MDKQVICCLKCEDLYAENPDNTIEKCPHCGNTDTKQTIYLEDSIVRREFLKESEDE